MASRTVVARNWATESSNRIHADDVAARHGFRGGLVPGVTTIAYLVPAVVEAFGPRWLSGGRLTVRLTAPVYDGEAVTARAEADGTVRLLGGSGDDRVVASASLDHEDAPDLGGFPAAPRPPERPPAGPDTLAAGTVLATLGHRADGDAVRSYLAAIGDDVTLDAAVHPGWLLLDANEVLTANVVLGPWIHVGSDVHLLATVHDGEELETRSVVTAEYERKGHRFVELDVVTLASGQPAMLVHHRAIYRLRDPG